MLFLEFAQSQLGKAPVAMTLGEITPKLITAFLDHPDLPLSNNEAERALRHWVIARRIGMGTRAEQGTRAFAVLASVIETCRKRNVSPWPYLAEVIGQGCQHLLCQRLRPNSTDDSSLLRWGAKRLPRIRQPPGFPTFSAL